MIKLSSNTTGKDVYIAVGMIVAMYPGTTGAEILTAPGVIYTVKENLEDVLSAIQELTLMMMSGMDGDTDASN